MPKKIKETTKSISVQDEIQYEKSVKIIAKNLNGFLDTGIEFHRVKRDSLWRIEFSSFEEFCNKKFNLTRRYVDKIIEAAKTVIELPAESQLKITNAGVASEVARIPSDKRASVVESASKKGPVTGKSIREAAEIIDVEEEVLDSTGFPVPEELKPLWSRRNEVNEYLSALSEIKCAVDKALKDEDPLFFEVSNSLVSMLQNCYGSMTLAKPYAVCTVCNGKNNEKCLLCKGRGLLSKFRYEGPSISQSTRDMRKKMGGSK